MNFWRKTQGAVSIFLVIILVPMMTFAALFVDASKIRLARGVAESAGDLTLNTALTDYDTMLKDLYGLFATVQDTDELYEKLESYYKTCIVSSGVDEADATDITQQLMQLLNGVEASGDTADILNMQLMDFNMSKRSDISLANAAVLEKQIVEFMKYRAPINTGLSFLSSLKTFTTLSKQTDLVEKRKEYYEAEESVMKKLHEAWKHINEYNKLPLITDEQYFQKMKEDFSNSATGWETKYKNEINKKTIKDLYDTQNYVNYHCSVFQKHNQQEKDAFGNVTTVSLWTFSYAEAGTPAHDYLYYYENGKYDADDTPSASDIKTLMINYYSNLQSADAYLGDVQTVLTRWDTVNHGPNDAYLLQVLVQAMRKGLPTYTSKLQSVYSTYQQLKNAMIWLEACEEEEKQEIKNTKIKIQGQEKTISEWFSTITTSYEKQMVFASDKLQRLTNISENNIGSKTNTSQTGQTALEIGSKIEEYVTNIESGAKELEDASKLLGEAQKLITEELAKAKANWSGAASDPDLKNTSIARQDMAEIDELGKYLNNEEITKMINRLNNVAANLRKNAEQIRKYKFDNVFLGDIQTYDAVKSAIEKKVGASALKSVELSESALNNQADGWFEWASERVEMDWINQSGTQPKLHGTGTDKLNFYSYMYTHFNKTDEANAGHGTTEKEEDKEKGEKLIDKIKDTSSSSVSSEASEEENAEGGVELKDLANRPSLNIGSDAATASAEVESGSDAAKNTSSSLSSMFSVLGEAIKNFGEGLRDRLYVMDYIMSMFSYDTITKEAAKNGKEVQTLTLTPIDADHNASYGHEVEYIIYGGSNSSNVTKAYGSIYAIRLGFNLVYAFMDSEIRDSAFAMATPISAATLGIVPVPLIQAVIIIGIACIESGLDLASLREGEKVPLFKNKETWVCSVSGLLNTTAKYAAEKVIDYAVDTGAQKLGEVLDMTNEELTAFIQNGTDELTGDIDHAFQTLIERHANTAIQKLTTLVNNALEEYAMNPAFNMADYVKTQLDEWVEMDNNGTDDLAYIVKKKAVDIIKSQYIDSIISAMQQAKDDVTSSVEAIGNKLKEQIERIRNKILTAIESGSAEVQAYKDKMMQKIKASMEQGAGELKDTLKEELDGVFGGGGAVDASDNTGMASLLSFSYGDYMRLFLMIGLYTNEEAILLRTGDAIQANVAKQSGKDGYALSKSAAYVELSVEVQVKPLLLPLPIFAGVENNPAANSNWYTITYEGIKGY